MKTQQRHKRLLFVVISTIASGFIGTGPQAFAEQQQAAVLEEVIVTAQRREESLQDVAISMTVFNQEQLANANVTNTSDLAALTPSLSADTRFGPENASFSVRGFTQAQRTTASVGVYFSEVVAPRGQAIQTSGNGAGPGVLFDLQNVQVLKGAQGTLFGRNTTGGAVLFEPQKPTDQLEGYVELSTGDFGLRQQQAVLNLPVTDRFRVRLGLDSKDREGHLDNVTDIGADKLGNVHYKAGRVSALWDITDALENYTLVNYTDSETKGNTARLFACNDAAVPGPDNPVPAPNPIHLITVPGCQQQLEDQRAAGQDGFYDLVSTVATPVTAIEDLRVINKLSWNLTDNVTVKNILSYMHLETENGSDIFGTRFTETQATLTTAAALGLVPPANIPLAADPDREFVAGVSLIAPDVPVTSQETYVAEIQVQGLSFDSRLQWQGGLYYENSTPDGFSGNNSAILVSCELATLESPDPEDFNCFDPLNGALGGVSEPRVKMEYTNKAVYAQASYDFFEWLSLTAGGRYTWDDTRGDMVFTLHHFSGNQRQAPVVTDESEVQHSEAPTGVIELQYRPLPDVMIYGKYVRGYRQGSVNMAADAGVQEYDEETVDTYEVGAKTSWEWLIPGRFNIAVFDNDFRDMQLQTGYVSSAKGPTTAIFNAGKAEIHGIEADALFQLYDGLSLSLAYSYLDTELLEQQDNCEKVEAAAGTVGGLTCSPSADVGDTLPFAPEKSYTASLQYRLPLPPEIGAISVGATHIYNGVQRTSASSSTPFDELDPYRLLNLNLGWENILGFPLDLSVFATNVRDKEYVTNIPGSFNSLGFEVRQMGLPRMYGARLSYHF